MFDSVLNTMREFPWAFAVPAGVLCAFAYRWCTRHGLKICDAPAAKVSVAETVIMGLLTAGLAWLVIAHRVQITNTDVVPPSAGEVAMLVYHLVLTVLLLSAASVDFRTSYIPDFIPVYGALIGIAGAFAIGDLQIMHLWVDWTQELPQLQGAAVPDWIEHHRHLHGLAWSVAGLAAGAGCTLLLRGLSGVIIGREALGMGDVFLMGMAGSFLGWQAVIISLAIAPVVALVGAGLIWMTGRQREIPYGPFLAAGALITLFAWRLIWMFEFDVGEPHGPTEQADFALRRMFGDAIGLGMIAGGIFGALCLLLGIMRWVKSMPAEKLAGRRR
jgi:leader peptidase (prepilin peptidase)/N-methyltransferase